MTLILQRRPKNHPKGSKIFFVWFKSDHAQHPGDYDYDILVPRVFSDKKTRIVYEDSIEDDEELNLDDCEINLYPKTYLRGSKTTITRQINSSVTDLSLHSFDDMLKSLEVKGSCCWSIFADKHFRGPHKQFRTGQYKSSTMIGADLVGEASSLKITVC